VPGTGTCLFGQLRVIGRSGAIPVWRCGTRLGARHRDLSVAVSGRHCDDRRHREREPEVLELSASVATVGDADPTDNSAVEQTTVR
jgi:hypothetical protein